MRAILTVIVNSVVNYFQSTTENNNIMAERIINYELINAHPDVTNTRFSRTIISRDYEITHNLTENTNLFDVEFEIDQMFNEIITPLLQNARENDIITGYIFHNRLQTPIFVVPQRVLYFKRHHKSKFLESAFNVIQSNKTILLDGRLSIEISITRPVSNIGVQVMMTAGDKNREKLSVVRINTIDKDCLLRAVCVARYYKENDVKNKKVRDAIRAQNKQRELARQLAQQCAVTYGKPLNIPDVQKIQSHLSEYQIVLIESHNNTVKFTGDILPNYWYERKQLYLLWTENSGNTSHVDVITNITAFLSSPTKHIRSFCLPCGIGFQWHYFHNCDFTCNKCKTQPPHNDSNTISCSLCNRDFKGQQCFDAHKLEINKNVSVCINFTKCLKCKLVYNRNKQHVCKRPICEKCGKQVQEKYHKCFIQPMNAKRVKLEDGITKIFIFYDIETCFDRTMHKYMQIPVLLHAETYCYLCLNNDTLDRPDDCDLCGEKSNTFTGFSCVENFMKYLTDISKNAKKSAANVFVLAHNAKGFDNNFILREVVEKNYMDMHVILQGSKLLRMKVGNVKFIDTLSFLNMPLRSLPKAYGCQQLAKGFFPHSIHTKKNVNYKGYFPSMAKFGLDYMKPEEAKELRDWWVVERQSYLDNNMVYDLAAELKKYCKNDVQVLAKCFLTFRREMIAINNIDPCTRAFTLASVAMEVFRTNMLQQNKIAITPINGYTNNRNQSKVAKSWLDFLVKQNNIVIHREHEINGQFVDGYCFENSTVYEFNGCLFHGHDCPINAGKDRNQPLDMLDNKTLNQILEKSNKRISELQSEYTVVIKCECEFNQEMSRNEFLAKYIKQRKAYYSRRDKSGGGINARSAFFGGRTNCISHYHKCTDDSTIHYIDFKSLYPYVLKYRNFPIGHPRVITEHFDLSLRSYFGIIKCIILPPKDLYLPVLPVRVNKKLVFPLCQTCASEMNQTTCTHTDAERQLTGCWVISEVIEAMECGYVIKNTKHIIEVWDFKESSGKLFQEYVNTFLKLKQESEGFPAYIQNHEEKNQYIDQFNEVEHVLMNYESIVSNPAKRSVSKLLLNTLWGKFAQTPNLPQTKICRDYRSRWDLLTNDKVNILSDTQLTPEVAIVNYTQSDETKLNPGKTSVVLAAFVTSYARIKLYSVLKQLNRRVLYFDTDSVIYSVGPDDRKIPCGSFLGDLVDEVESKFGDMACINEFASLGPKTYCLNIRKADATEESIIRAKGITLNKGTVKLINVKSMIEMAHKFINGQHEVLHVPQMVFRCTKTRQLYTEYIKKQFRAISEKRRLCANGTTLPFGYVE